MQLLSFTTGMPDIISIILTVVTLVREKQVTEVCLQLMIGYRQCNMAE